MRTITARNVHEALPLGLNLLTDCGIPMPSRVGDVLSVPYPVITEYERPTERVLFYAERDAQPYFHFFESLWILAGRNDVAYLTQFVKRMKDFSDDGETLSGAYGYRLRKSWDFDQIETVIQLLKKDPFTRRAVVSMWDPVLDLLSNEQSKDKPCNDMLIFRQMYGERDKPNKLHMSVINRSNDLLWGQAGSNAVHFSMLQEYVAGQLGLDVGHMHTYSANLHAYTDVYNKIRQGALASGVDPGENPYITGEVAPYPMIQDASTWDRDLKLFMEDPFSNGYENKFFSRVAKPLWFSHKAYKKKNYKAAFDVLRQCDATDWKKACHEWLKRRLKTAIDKELEEIVVQQLRAELARQDDR